MRLGRLKALGCLIKRLVFSFRSVGGITEDFGQDSDLNIFIFVNIFFLLLCQIGHCLYIFFELFFSFINNSLPGRRNVCVRVYVWNSKQE